MRVRGFTQDDGHIFCTEDQILSECTAYTKLVQKVYADYGFTDISYKIATRPEKRIGDDATWDKAEKALMDALDASGIKYDILPGEGAFYGPKIEYHLRDSLGRGWQCGTIQVDFQMPARLGAEYVTESNGRATPVMLHRAIVGSLERFIGMLLEHYAGQLPPWLAPVQVAVANITDDQADYAKEVVSMLKRRVFVPKQICETAKLHIRFANLACRSFLTSSLSELRKRQKVKSRFEFAAARILAP